LFDEKNCGTFWLFKYFSASTRFRRKIIIGMDFLTKLVRTRKIETVSI